MKAAASKRWLGLIEGLLDAVWLVEARTMRIVVANSAACSLFGASPTQLVGRPASELAATPEDQCFWDDAAAGLSNGILSDTLIRRFDGRVVPIARRVTRLDQDDSMGAVFVVAMHDRGAQSRAEAERETLLAELQATLESSGDAILVTDLGGRIRWFNDRFARMWAVPAGLLKRRDAPGVQAFMKGCVVEQWPVLPLGRELSEGDAARLRVAAAGRRAHDPGGEAGSARDRLRLKSGVVVERVSHPQTRRGEVIGQVYSFHEVDVSAVDPLPDAARGARAMDDVVAFALGGVALERSDEMCAAEMPTVRRESTSRAGSSANREAERVGH
ncbi:MAG: diguanylate cyclase [Rhizobacter sp.]|nr:diguanylate cyclase [Rhizobacter sp.]